MSKLLFIVTEDWYFCSHRLALAVAARNAGMEVTVVTRISDKRRDIESFGIKVVPFEIDRSNLNPLKEVKTIWRLYSILRAQKADVVHLVALKPVVLGGIAAFFSGTHRMVLAVAGMGFLFTGDARRGKIFRYIVTWILGFLAHYSKIIVQNSEDATLLKKHGIESSRISLIRGSGVDLQRFCPRPEREGPPVIMLPSRLLWDKGVGEFVEAARVINSHEVEAKFVLVGGPDPANPASVTKQDLDNWGQKGIVAWWGKRQDMPEVLARAHVVCLPSFYREGMPKVLLEAMACGRPCVTTDTPGCREAVRDGDNGFLVPVRDVDGLVSALRRLLEDAELRVRMGRRGRERAEKEFSEEKVIEETLAIYKELLGGALT